MDTAKPWKVASKGVRLSSDDIIGIVRGNTVVHKKESPTFSLSRMTVSEEKMFVTRSMRMRVDKGD